MILVADVSGPLPEQGAHSRPQGPDSNLWHVGSVPPLPGRPAATCSSGTDNVWPFRDRCTYKPCEVTLQKSI